MRFCPFCTAENVADATTCVQCGRRLPPPPTRKRPPGAQPTGIQPVPSSAVTVPTPATAVDEEKRALRAGLLPPPSAARRKGLTGEVRPSMSPGGEARRKDDATAVGGPSGDDTKTRV